MTKTSIIIGGTAGVGLSTAIQFANLGHNVVIIGRRGLDDAVNTIRNVSGSGDVLGINSDVCDPVSVELAFKDIIQRFPVFDNVILNAGLNRIGPIESISEEDAYLVLNTNVMGVYRWLKAVLPTLKAQKSGQIVVTSSICGLRSSANNSIYCASKHAVEAIVDSVRQETQPFNIKIASVNPACIATNWWSDKTRGGCKSDETNGGSNSYGVALENMISPEAVAESIVYICEQPLTSNIRRIHTENI